MDAGGGKEEGSPAEGSAQSTGGDLGEDPLFEDWVVMGMPGFWWQQTFSRYWGKEARLTGPWEAQGRPDPAIGSL